jgi:hypothetical protein
MFASEVFHQCGNTVDKNCQSKQGIMKIQKNMGTVEAKYGMAADVLDKV